MDATLVVAGLWVRALAASAHRTGWRVIALDLFGDGDTCHASARWERIGDPVSFAITPALLRDALRRAAREPEVLGWVAGSGFEGSPELLDLHIPGLPLLGMDGDAVRRVRDPVTFFGTLDRLGLPHPDVCHERPANPEDWLVKDPGGCGGWHIRAASGEDHEGGYWQRFQPGDSLSVLFLADGARAQVVALNRLLVRPLGSLPFVYHGAIGPVRDEALLQGMEEALALLVPAFGLRGLASLDFLVHEGRAWLLEVNPRPSATMVLHDADWPRGLVHAHVRAVQGELPERPAAHAAGVRGSLIVFAEHACRAGDLAHTPHVHDLPAVGAVFARGEPVCSVSAEADGEDAVLRELDLRADHVRALLVQQEDASA